MKHHLFLSFVAVVSTLITGCATGRQIQFVDRIQRDTIYINKVHYDSIFVSHDRTTDYHLNPLNPLKPSESDTLFIHDRTIEYRYKLLRDTVYKTRIDSIPVVREVEVIREVPRPKTWFDYITRFCFFFLIGFSLIKLFKLVKPFFLK